MTPYDYDERVEESRFAPASPAVIWGALMIAALAGAGASLWRAPGAGPTIAAEAAEITVRRDLARLTAERDALATRVAALERGLGEVRLAQRAAEPDVTGSIGRGAPAPTIQSVRPVFGLSLGPDASLDAVRRRWAALSARYPQQLARLTPRAQKGDVAGVYDLVAGPFSSRSDAEKACTALADQGLGCDTTNYSGDPLVRP